MVKQQNWGAGEEKWKLYAFYAQYFCKPKTTLNNKIYFYISPKVNFIECSFNKTNLGHILPEIQPILLNKFINLSFHKNISHLNL